MRCRRSSLGKHQSPRGPLYVQTCCLRPKRLARQSVKKQYFDALRRAKEQFRATMNAILLALVVLRGAGYWAVGEYTRDVLLIAAIALPMMLVGIFIGNRVHTGLNELAFRRLVSGALIVSGLALLAKSG